MAELFRSANMTYVAITMTKESVRETLYRLGQFGGMHLEDMTLKQQQQTLAENTDDAITKQQNTYKKRVADCAFWEKKLQHLEEHMKKYMVKKAHDTAPKTRSIVCADVLEAVEAAIQPIEAEVERSMQFLQKNDALICEAIEQRHVLNAVAMSSIASGQTNQSSYDGSDMMPLFDTELGLNGGQRFRTVIAGTIPIEEQLAFSRMLYRLSRGNALARFRPIDDELLDPISGEKVEKAVFYVVVLGQQLRLRTLKVCETVRATVFNIPSSSVDCELQISLLNQEIADKKMVKSRTEEHVETLLRQLADNDGGCPLRDWQNALLQEKAICGTLMKAHFFSTMVAIEGWVPSHELRGLRKAVKLAARGTGHPPAAVEIEPATPIARPPSPPTWFPVNKFTHTFQGIVDTYGVPRYKEVNPGLFTIISFPFLFGVMYGDIGHGSLLTLFALLLIIFEKKLLAMRKDGRLGEIPSMAFDGRYVLIIMGLFATYCGIIYNDCFSISIDLYGSGYKQLSNGEYVWDGTTYPLGIDPVWMHKTNELAFTNSFKMKMAVTLGVTQMLFGIMLSLSNHLFFSDRISIWFEFIPRLLFMCSTFGYMILMIILKWCIDWQQASNPPPNLIQTMISMFLSPGSVDPDNLLYNGQAAFQAFLVFVALVCVPVMLFGKPYANKHMLKRQQMDALRNDVIAQSNQELLADVDHHGDMIGDASGSHIETTHSFSDELIHQAIHTIEFVLGCVSNTASYLRLWALSLAHAELSAVFFDKMILQYGIETGSAVSAVIGFAVWFGATTGVLMAMDVLECFLHALRLHWVEFQSKFYYADGRAFDAFKFAELQ